MKKSVLLALAALAMAGTPAVAQEVIFEPDCSQGILKNAAKDNWFITVQGGTNLLWNKGDNEAAWKDRFGGNAALFIGKWIDPNVGFRFGANWLMPKGATTADGMFRDYKHAAINNTYYPEKFMAIGPHCEMPHTISFPTLVFYALRQFVKHSCGQVLSTPPLCYIQAVLHLHKLG